MQADLQACKTLGARLQSVLPRMAKPSVDDVWAKLKAANTTKPGAAGGRPVCPDNLVAFLNSCNSQKAASKPAAVQSGARASLVVQTSAETAQDAAPAITAEELPHRISRLAESFKDTNQGTRRSAIAQAKVQTAQIQAVDAWSTRVDQVRDRIAGASAGFWSQMGPGSAHKHLWGVFGQSPAAKV